MPTDRCTSYLSGRKACEAHGLTERSATGGSSKAASRITRSGSRSSMRGVIPSRRGGMLPGDSNAAVLLPEHDAEGTQREKKIANHSVEKRNQALHGSSWIVLALQSCSHRCRVFLAAWNGEAKERWKGGPSHGGKRHTQGIRIHPDGQDVGVIDMTLVESERHQRPLFQGNLQPIASPRPRAAPPD